MEYKFQKDKYSRARGGRQKLLTVNCAKCNTPLFNYQKDGPGSLKRCYLDRITTPKIEIIENKKIACPNCQQDIAYPTIYEKENRPAFKMLWGNFKLTKVAEHS